MIALILAQKIASLFLMMLAGFLLVKKNVLTVEHSRVLSSLTVYLFNPCALINAFQIQVTDEIRSGLLLAFAAAVLIHILYILVTVIMNRLFRLSIIDRSVLMFPNAANLVLPIVSSMFGPEWVIYSSAFMVVQSILFWSYGYTVIGGEKTVNFKKMFLNLNMLAVGVGLILFFTGFRFPNIISESISSLGSVVGPAAMLVTGMLIGGADLKDIFRKKEVWLISAGRLLLLPALALLLLNLTGMTHAMSNAFTICMIVFLAAAGPSASIITQTAILFNRDVEHAGAVNVLSTLLCIVTMPLMVRLFEVFC